MYTYWFCWVKFYIFTIKYNINMHCGMEFNYKHTTYILNRNCYYSCKKEKERMKDVNNMVRANCVIHTWIIIIQSFEWYFSYFVQCNACTEVEVKWLQLCLRSSTLVQKWLLFCSLIIHTFHVFLKNISVCVSTIENCCCSIRNVWRINIFSANCINIGMIESSLSLRQTVFSYSLNKHLYRYWIKSE